MVRLFTLLWIVGLFTLVPYATWYLLFEASRDQYALLITLVLFWLFGYWGVAGPIIAAVRVRKFFRALESIGSKQELQALMRRGDSEDAIVDLIATDNGLPRFVARRMYHYLRRRFTGNNRPAPGGDD